MDVFAALNGISPWWWIAAALVLGTIEVLTFSFFLIWPGLAALAVGILMFIFPDMSGSIQVLVFALLSVVLTIIGRAIVQRNKPQSENPGLNRRSGQMIGRKAVVIDGFVGGGLGNVEVDGIRWRARLAEAGEPPASGAVLSITDADGMTLVLSPPA